MERLSWKQKTIAVVGFAMVAGCAHPDNQLDVAPPPVKADYTRPITELAPSSYSPTLDLKLNQDILDVAASILNLGYGQDSLAFSLDGSVIGNQDSDGAFGYVVASRESDYQRFFVRNQYSPRSGELISSHLIASDINNNLLPRELAAIGCERSAGDLLAILRAEFNLPEIDLVKVIVPTSKPSLVDEVFIGVAERENIKYAVRITDNSSRSAPLLEVRVDFINKYSHVLI